MGTKDKQEASQGRALEVAMENLTVTWGWECIAHRTAVGKDREYTRQELNKCSSGSLPCPLPIILFPGFLLLARLSSGLSPPNAEHKFSGL